MEEHCFSHQKKKFNEDHHTSLTSCHFGSNPRSRSKGIQEGSTKGSCESHSQEDQRKTCRQEGRESLEIQEIEECCQKTLEQEVNQETSGEPKEKG